MQCNDLRPNQNLRFLSCNISMKQNNFKIHANLGVFLANALVMHKNVHTRLGRIYLKN